MGRRGGKDFLKESEKLTGKNLRRLICFGLVTRGSTSTKNDVIAVVFL